MTWEAWTLIIAIIIGFTIRLGSIGKKLEITAGGSAVAFVLSVIQVILLMRLGAR